MKAVQYMQVLLQLVLRQYPHHVLHVWGSILALLDPIEQGMNVKSVAMQVMATACPVHGEPTPHQFFAHIHMVHECDWVQVSHR